MLRVGADIGGTFTDIVFLGPDGAVRAAKLLSTPDDYCRAILDGLRGERARTSVAGADRRDRPWDDGRDQCDPRTARERRVGLMTTSGFRDVLEIRRVRCRCSTIITWEKPEPLVRREPRHEIDERVGPGGAVRKPLDLEIAREGDRAT